MRSTTKRKTDITEGLAPLNPILLVDDDVAVLNAFDQTLGAVGIKNVVLIEEGARLLEFIAKREIELVILDLGIPDISGEDLLDHLQNTRPEIPVIIMTGRSDVQTAIKCMRKGAVDYLVKPVESNLFLSSVKMSIDMAELRRENMSLRQSLLTHEFEIPEHFSSIITRNSKMEGIFKYLKAVAPTRQTILITGETGVGKELVAQSIHKISGLSGNFVTVNVAGLDDNLFSDMLFGHKKGAFTGAITDRPGLIDRAEGGTLFLDEIGDLTPSSQIKLLRLLQEREYYPLGADISKNTNARFVFATHHDLENLQDSGDFRPDLYYRLSAHQFEIPPLRERQEDIPPLIDHFVESAAKTFGKQIPTYSRELVSLLSTYHYPGNIRELQNIIMDAVAQNIGGTLSPEGIRSDVNFQRKLHSTPPLNSDLNNASPVSGLSVNATGPFPTLNETEEFILMHALKRAEGNQLTAAKLLDISRQSLQRRMKKYDVSFQAN